MFFFSSIDFGLRSLPGGTPKLASLAKEILSCRISCFLFLVLSSFSFSFDANVGNDLYKLRAKKEEREEMNGTRKPYFIPIDQSS